MKHLGIVVLLVLISFLSACQSNSDSQTIDKDIKTDTAVFSDEQSPNILRQYEAPDYIEGFNRVIQSFNEGLVGCVVKPAAKVYSFICPDYVRACISRFSYNLQIPGRFINCLLQGRFKRSGIELVRFGVNTTVGIVGFWDVADPWLGLRPQVNNFGMTFQYWGIGSGFYLVIPVLASSTLRDGIGMIFDLATDPMTYIPFSSPAVILFKLNDVASVIDEYTIIHDSSRDPYYTFKNVYFVQRILYMQSLETNGIRGEDSLKTSTEEDTNRNE